MPRMGYYMRYFVEDGEPLTMADLATGLPEMDPLFRVEADGHLHRADQMLGRLEINTPGDGLFQDEMDELVEAIGEVGGQEAEALVGRLRQAKAVVAIEVYFRGRSVDETMDLLDPLWEWLGEHREGMLHADGEGFYQDELLIFALD